ncbi:unnamed protein product [Didymodactylos carnosus]|uniref:Uncharacterized protein n=1 Tax=Didymodactylos carnosus TaxID=1234261 RepID=A0A814YQ25_9BILA|nr:unnamed protein product [Didymodactylos carnosus]CAF1233078.1 unnamed protein product [Didymodactylos carnosus]CAF3845605.1 unnamed protein product [Didymodactylos carnosus]CAF3995760.1 unnamed protein product [Didymodactylos carnosus]
MSLKQSIRAIYKVGQKYLKNYNLFRSHLPTTDEHDLRNELISTRLFIIVLFISLITIVLYTSVPNRTIIVTRKSPTFEQYEHLYQKYQKSLLCSCATIAVPYGTFFTEIFQQQHQLCSSQFVTNEWVAYLNNESAAEIYYRDFRRTSGYSFQMLSRLCQLTNQTLKDEFLAFNSTAYITPSLVSVQIFESETQLSIKQFQLTTTNAFLTSLDIVRSTTRGNGLMSGLLTNTELRSTYGGDDNSYRNVISASFNNGNCSCDLTIKCVESSAIYTFYPSSEFSGKPATLTTEFIVPGFYLGCYLLESLLQSTLECFYDQACLDEIQSWIFTDYINITPLVSTQLSQYQPNTTIKEILNNLMIEQWYVTTSYQLYYGQCNPSECIYSYSDSFDILYILTKIITLIGGLTKLSRILVPRVVKLWRRKKITTINVISIRQRLYNLYKSTTEYLKSFNIFKPKPPSTDEHEVKNQIISTRLFIVIFLALLTVLAFYSSFHNPPRTVVVKTPTMKQYDNLYSTYSNTLDCPCSKTSIPYKTFLQISPTYHQVCSSQFVSDEWYKYIIENRPSIISAHDFRLIGVSSFEMISEFCQFSNQTIQDQLFLFYSRFYLSLDLISNKTFQLQSLSFIEQFQSETRNTFLRLLQLTRDTTHGSHFYSSINTNYQITVYTNPNGLYTITSTQYYGGSPACVCDINSKCVQLTGITDTFVTSQSLDFVISGFMTGCYIIESLLQSTLECFYNETCFNTLRHYMNATHYNRNFTTLYSSLSNSQYKPETTIETIVNNLMIEQWNPSISFGSYYNECHPSECTYTYTAKLDIVYVLTTIIGLIVGLSVVLTILIPNLVNLIREKRTHAAKNGKNNY